jgi:hypothetical protein
MEGIGGEVRVGGVGAGWCRSGGDGKAMEAGAFRWEWE